MAQSRAEVANPGGLDPGDTRWGLAGHGRTFAVYSTEEKAVEEVLVAAGMVDRPLVFVTAQRTSPRAVAIAGAMRLAGRATIVGYDLHAAVAESKWRGVGASGLAWRYADRRRASDSSVLWPDRIPADVSTSTPKLVLPELAELLIDTPIDGGDASRAPLGIFKVSTLSCCNNLPREAMKVMLLAAYGTLDRFYTYFDIVGNHIDQALVDGLGEIEQLEPGDQQGAEHVLGRFMHELYDGHGFYYGNYDPPTGYLMVQIDEIDGEAVIRSSNDKDILVGDTIIGINDQAADAWFEEAMRRYSAATFGYRFALAARELVAVHGSIKLKLRDSEGVEKTVTPSLGSYVEYKAMVPWSGTFRPNGWLDDLGAPQIYFLNMSRSVTVEWPQFEEAISEAQSAVGLIVDMRGYPEINHYEVSKYLVQEEYTSPIFGYPTWDGPDNMSIVQKQFELTPNPGAIKAPIVLMVSHRTVSRAENFSQMLYGDDNVTVLGQQSAGTNGNITGTRLPGGFSINFTGMQLLNPDGTTLHGVGIPLDIEVEPTAADFAAGIDPELKQAIIALGG